MEHLLSFPKNYFQKNIQRPLSPAMIKTLMLACNKQKDGIFFGPQDIKGSAVTLIRRGLIASHTIERNGKTGLTWFVTERAINMLSDIGIKILC
ncbi:MAG TPA: hypothetical protein VMY77_12750 [Chitinophagaceae bacterium]|nr:hypothetical protein [Chitinophagaceae bacterium]